MPCKKRRIAYSTRSSFWPCGTCRLNCASDSVLCDSCKSWYHYSCENLTNSDIDWLSESDAQFTCLACMKEEIGSTYSYQNGLFRLSTAAKNGYQSLAAATRREASFISRQPMPEAVSVQPNIHSVDYNSKFLLDNYSSVNSRVPLLVSGDGNCLFNAISMALYGNELYSDELRVKTCVEMVLNSQRYKSHSSATIFFLISPTFEEACVDCSTSGNYSSVWTLMATSEVIARPIKSVYPNVNGDQDLAFQTLNTTFTSSTEEMANEPVYIMWTRTCVKNGNIWTPNHFVPLLTKDTNNARSTFDSFDSLEIGGFRMNGSILSSTIDAEVLMDSACVSDNSFETINCDDSGELQNTEEKSERNDTPTSLPSDSNVPSLHPIPKGGLSACDIYEKVSSDTPVFSDVPHGDKSNKFMLVDNTANMERRTNNKRSVFHDEVGVWDSTKGTTTTTYYVLSRGFKNVNLHQNQYCFKQVIRKKLHFVPLDPQPQEQDVVKMHRYYTSLKRQPGFKKKVYWFSCAGIPNLSNVALIEYNGILDNSLEARHGNSKYNEEPYRRTDKKILEKAIKEMETKKPRHVYKEMALNNSFDIPRDFQQLRHLKYRENRKKRTNIVSNIADEILAVLEMVKEHEFVQHVEHTKGQIPRIILYSEEQMLDFQHFLKTVNQPRVGIDRTFNLGSFYVTSMVYKNHRVFKKDTLDHPIFLGPILLHKEANFETYHYFLSHVNARLSIAIENIDIKIPNYMEIGSDDEKALTKAIDACFPEAKRSLCTKHLKDNVSEYLKNKVGIKNSSRRNAIEKIFGEEGVSNANDTYQFEERSNTLTTEYSGYPLFVKYFRERLKPKLELNMKSLQNPRDRQWTNNNAESIHNIFKLDINWTPQCLPELINKVTDVVRLHLIDLRRALCNQGNYSLSGEYKKFVIKEDVFRAKNKEERDRYFRKFLKSSPPSERNIKSTQCSYTVPLKTKNVATKPAQRKRPRNSKTTKKF